MTYEVKKLKKIAHIFIKIHLRLPDHVYIFPKRVKQIIIKIRRW